MFLQNCFDEYRYDKECCWNIKSQFFLPGNAIKKVILISGTISNICRCHLSKPTENWVILADIEHTISSIQGTPVDTINVRRAFRTTNRNTQNIDAEQIKQAWNVPHLNGRPSSREVLTASFICYPWLTLSLTRVTKTYSNRYSWERYREFIHRLVILQMSYITTPDTYQVISIDSLRSSYLYIRKLDNNGFI